MGDKSRNLKKTLSNYLDSAIKIVKTGKSASIRILTTVINHKGSVNNQLEAMEKSFDAINIYDEMACELYNDDIFKCV